MKTIKLSDICSEGNKSLHCPDCEEYNLHFNNDVKTTIDKIEIPFWCEHCDGFKTLTIKHHEGVTSIFWYLK